MSTRSAAAVTSLAERLECVPSATVYDIMDERGLGQTCVLSHEIRGLRTEASRAGPAFTVRWVRDPRTVRQWRPAGLQRITDYFAPIEPGDIVVVHGADDRSTAHWGEMLSTMAWRHGARGVVIDGGIRDSQGVLSIPDFEPFARYRSPIESIKRMRIHDVDVPLMLEGAFGDYVQVRPGDWILADTDAVLVIPAEIVDEVAVAAEALEEIENKARTELRAGTDIGEVFRKYGRA
ncbi:MAG: dimethylmenaquinone methyltransferase [Dehalococcoidia bacterium]|nr:dimethylmenaquinone methyltransferase [Dehalococcoidia bacterium]